MKKVNKIIYNGISFKVHVIDESKRPYGDNNDVLSFAFKIWIHRKKDILFFKLLDVDNRKEILENIFTKIDFIYKEYGTYTEWLDFHTVSNIILEDGFFIFKTEYVIPYKEETENGS